MSGGRKIGVSLLVAILLGGHAIDLCWNTEHWPFSNYPMYAKVLDGRVLKSMRLFGVDDAGREFSFERTAFLWPLGPKKANKTIVRLAQENDDAALRAAMRDCGLRYESRRLAGVLQGPALKRLRLYRLQWDVDPWARNAKAASRQLVHEEVLP